MRSLSWHEVAELAWGENNPSTENGGKAYGYICATRCPGWQCDEEECALYADQDGLGALSGGKGGVNLIQLISSKTRVHGDEVKLGKLSGEARGPVRTMHADVVSHEDMPSHKPRGGNSV
eukprot:CAMPEP_0202892012 /NCGR_PEP_ID=MMETSP1392-20130828/1884_1 /ASSEMBLY_ACC=CAM_ASM_000868 /TAXON_ID=225041 /ORGANISM="Chlamydomonas chlamydogama, Strain SAG 11-48b" /LENGTH=119 /DNA_ID=CAMNT_0049575887 /DNA_START=1 /DNA_END=359 /DNA_ORIENTATION=+